jgi:hypothetical protein
MNTRTGVVTLFAPTVESLQVDVYASVDPTGTAPGFLLTAEGTMATTGSSFTSGTWVGTYGSDGWTVARTPTIGTAGSLTATAGRYWLWASVVAGSETAKWIVGTLVVS